MSVYAVYISKGGTGKTSSAVNLACVSALGGTPTLLWDLDPQGGASFILGQEMGLDNSGKKLVSGRRHWDDEVRNLEIPHLHLIPGDSSLRNWDILLDEEKHARRVLADWLKPLRERFGVIILDCPPGLSLLSENLFRAADQIIAPVLPSALGMRTLDQLKDFLGDSEKKGPIIKAFLSMVDRRKPTHRELGENPPSGFLRTYVPLLAEIEKMAFQRMPSVCRNSGQSSEIFSRLWWEIQDS